MIRFGTINCSCGQTFHVESVNDSVSCIRCAKEHDISTFPELKPIESAIEEVAFEDIPNETPQEPQNGSEGA